MSKVFGGKRRSGPARIPSLIEHAYAIHGLGTDPCKIANALFDAAFDSLKAVQTKHPGRWPMLIGYYLKLAALYEEGTSGEGSAGDGLVVQKSQHPDRHNMVGHVPGEHLTVSTNARPKI